MNAPKIAIVYDRINKFGGAEQVLLSLHKLFPDAPLYTSVLDRQSADWVGDWPVRTSFLQHIPFAKKHHEWFGWLMPLAFESLDLTAFDIVISVTSEAAKGIITNPRQMHICYCLTPTRYLWSHTHLYERGRLHWLKRFVFSKLRAWDYIASTRPDKMIAISNHVAKRIEKYYRRKVDEVIYPPVHTDNQELRMKNKGDYLLVVSRLVPYKKVDLAINACLKAGKKLVIVGTGSDEQRLRTIAGKSTLITFAGFVNDEELAHYYRHATALLCPQEEDFGIVSLEAQGFGIPVITATKSGVSETIIEGKTGLSFESNLAEVLLKAESMQWNEADIHQNAKRFDEAVFSEHFQKLVASVQI